MIKPRRPVTLTTFLKEAAQTGNSIRYSAIKNETHRFYIPTFMYHDEEENQDVLGPIAEMHLIHEFKVGDKFHSVECTADITGTCPCCDRVSDAWAIYNDRIDKARAEFVAQGLDEATIEYKLSGEQDEQKRRLPNAYKGLKSIFSSELKMRAAKPYMYLLVAQYETDPSGTNPVIEQGLPKYTLKVMRLPKGRVESLQELFRNSGGVVEGNEFTIKYKNIDSRAELVGQSDMAAVFSDWAWVGKYPGLKEKINAEAAAFDMTSLSKSFEELRELEPKAVKQLADSSFTRWDAYQAEKQLNPGAQYLEYTSATATAGAAANTAGMTFALPSNNAPTSQPTMPVSQPTTPVPSVQAPPVQAPPAQPTTQVPPVQPDVPVPPVQAPPVQPDASAQQTEQFQFKI